VGERKHTVLWLGLDRLFVWLLRNILGLWVRVKVLPEDVNGMLGENQVPICFVLERYSLADLLVLDRVCLQMGLSRPLDALKIRGVDERRRVFYVRRNTGLFRGRAASHPADRLKRLVTAVTEDAALDVRVLPVSVFWGRSPDREQGVFRTLFSEGWAATGPVRKFFVVLLHGRNTMLQFARPIQLRQVVAEDIGEARSVRKVARVLRVHFRLQRVATIGPDLSHRRILVNKLLKSRKVRRAIDREMQSARLTRQKATSRARKYANEVAANYSYPVIRVAENILTWLWQKLYDGIEVNHFEGVREMAPGNEIIYVPCHRSHVDYLLLSYVLYHRGLVVPHIAAGINLNLPVLGSFLRGGGAFFLRRSFRGNQLYSAVFQQYLAMNLAKGVSIEYFIEGGRSRTGRLLPSRPGMLGMTLASFMNHRRRPLIFVPVYFGYERVLESGTYIAELSGRPKKKESILDLFRFLPTLRKKFGHVFVNFGEPLDLAQFLDARLPDWRDRDPGEDARPRWLVPVVEALGEEIQRRVNCAAAVGPVNLMTLVLLATPKQAMLEGQLVSQLELYAALLKDLQYSQRVTVSGMSGQEIVAYCEKLGIVQRRANKLGDIITMTEEQAVIGTYFRNNVLHLMSLPSLLACCFVNSERLSPELLLRVTKVVYPYMRAELFMRWSDEELAAQVNHALEVMGRHGLVQRGRYKDRYKRAGGAGGAPTELGLLASLTEQTVERFYVVIALLLRHGSGQVAEKALEEESQLMAERLSALFVLDSPEFFDRSLFRNFIRLMKEQGVISTGSDGKLVFDEAALGRVDEDAELLLSDDIRHAVRQVTQS